MAANDAGREILVKRVQAAGGRVHCIASGAIAMISLGSSPFGPHCDLVNDDWFHGLNWRFPIDVLDLSFAPVSDKCLEYMMGAQIRCLRLTATRVTDAGMHHLSTYSNLEELSLIQTEVTDAGISRLSGLSGLRKLSLADTSVTDRCLRHIVKLHRLVELSLDRTQISGIDVPDLSPLTKLGQFSSSDTAVDDNFIAKLVALPALKVLGLSGTNVTDIGLRMLAECRHLRLIDVSGARTTGAGRKEFVENRPEVHVECS